MSDATEPARAEGSRGAAAGSKRAVWAALFGNLLVAATKIAAAAVTGSAAMLSEAIHSSVDTGDELLLLYGMRVARRRADREHPAGYGREIYFWSFVVALLVFTLGAGVSILQGVHRLLHPQPIEHPLVSELVLGLSFLFEGGSWLVSMKQFRKRMGRDGYYEAFHKSKDPPLFMVLFEDSAALLGIAIAGAGTVLSAHLGVALADGASSIAIGLVLGCTSTMLAIESKSLLIGEQADPALVRSMLAIANQVCGTSKANGVLTLQLAPEEIMAAMSFEFDDSLRAPQIEELVAEIERKIRAAHPQVTSLFIKPQSPQQFARMVRRKFGDDAGAASQLTSPRPLDSPQPKAR